MGAQGAQEEPRKGQRKGSWEPNPGAQEGLRGVQKERRKGSGGTAQEPRDQGAQDQDGAQGNPEWVQKGHMGHSPGAHRLRGPRRAHKGRKKGSYHDFEQTR